MRPALRAVSTSPELPSAHAMRVADVRVKQALVRCIGRRVPRADAADMVQNVLEALLLLEDPPETIESLIALGIGILRHDLIDRYRHRKIVSKVETDSLDDQQREHVAPSIPAEAWGSIDVGKRSDVVRRLVAQGKLTDGDVDMLERTDDEGYGPLAAELGVTDTALRVRAHRKRAVLREGWSRYVASGLSGVLVLLLIAYVARHRREQEAHYDIAPDHSISTPLKTPLERAADLRKVADGECTFGSWQECVEHLDQARALDPAGDATPAVQEMREKANRAMHPPPMRRDDKPSP